MLSSSSGENFGQGLVPGCRQGVWHWTVRNGRSVARPPAPNSLREVFRRTPLSQGDIAFSLRDILAVCPQEVSWQEHKVMVSLALESQDKAFPLKITNWVFSRRNCQTGNHSNGAE